MLCILQQTPMGETQQLSICLLGDYYIYIVFGKLFLILNQKLPEHLKIFLMSIGNI